jgi:L-amino acid N-acyltransferase YncA
MDTKEIQIVDATLADLPSIVAIYNATIPSRMATADLQVVSVESKEKWFAEHSSEFRPIWVVKENEQVVAWFSFQSFYGRPAYNATAEVSIYVAASHHGCGLGSLMLEKAIQACPLLQIHTLLGFVFAHNEPSLRLLSKFGFSEWGHLPKIANLDGIERDLVIVGKRVE